MSLLIMIFALLALAAITDCDGDAVALFMLIALMMAVAA